MKTYMQKAMAFIQDEEGASAVEYALLVGVIAVADCGGGGCLGPCPRGQIEGYWWQHN